MRRVRPRRRAVRWTAALAAAGLAGLACFSNRAWADQSTGLTLGVPANANLKFTVNIDKFVFFRLGTGVFPVQSGTIDSAAFTLTPTIPGGPTTPVVANNTAANWNGAAPTFTVSPAAGVKLAVEVRSNAGQVSLYATASTPLTSTTSASTIPMSEITVASDSPALPAPAIPNAGAGASVTVTPTAFGTLVTQQAANWTFSYANLTNRPAGVYNGQVTFTASSP
ncbi:hypothetical protein VLK31_14690 [Variovorax sp. H27-G14]|uniref:hypothetical protein n=1 Tax=Variovorax sp. H27-G14 TaxID=3111914 RepID=UPI0038FC67FA